MWNNKRKEEDYTPRPASTPPVSPEPKKEATPLSTAPLRSNDFEPARGSASIGKAGSASPASGRGDRVATDGGSAERRPITRAQDQSVCYANDFGECFASRDLPRTRRAR